jgi:hypothetical protein
MSKVDKYDAFCTIAVAAHAHSVAVHVHTFDEGVVVVDISAASIDTRSELHLAYEGWNHFDLPV